MGQNNTVGAQADVLQVAQTLSDPRHLPFVGGGRGALSLHKQEQKCRSASSWCPYVRAINYCIIACKTRRVPDISALNKGRGIGDFADLLD